MQARFTVGAFAVIEDERGRVLLCHGRRMSLGKPAATSERNQALTEGRHLRVGQHRADGLQRVSATKH